MKLASVLNLFKQGKYSAKSHMKNLLEMALVDDHFDNSEEDLLKNIAKRYKVSFRELEEIREDPDSIEFEVPDDRTEKFSQLFDLVNMMMVDTHVDSEEVKLCHIFAKKFGYQEGKVKELVYAVSKNIENGKTKQDTMKRVEWLLN